MDYDEERHIRQTATTWLREPIGGFEFRYCNLDLYLMGMMSPSEVGRFTLIRRYTEVGPPLPGGRQLVRGTARNLLTRNIVWAEGKRDPEANDSQKQFRAAFVVVTRDASTLDPTFVSKVELLRKQLETYFALASSNRACVDSQLCCKCPTTRTGTVRMRLVANKITWSGYLYHGLGPVPARVEVGIQDSIGGAPIDVWPREETPDITSGVQHLSAQVNRDPYDGRFRIVAQRKGSTRNVTFRWSAVTLS